MRGFLAGLAVAALLIAAAAAYLWSTKHFQMVGGVQDPDDVPYILAMIDAVSGDRRAQRDR